MDVHNLGEFNSISDAWKMYPNGGGFGDYITVNGVRIDWSEYTNSWGEPDPGTPPYTPPTVVDGDLDVSGHGSFRKITTGDYIPNTSGSAIDEFGNGEFRTVKTDSLYIKNASGELVLLSEYIKTFKTELPPAWDEYTKTPLFDDIRILVFDANSNEKHYTTIGDLKTLIKDSIDVGGGGGGEINIQILRSDDAESIPTDNNVFAALRTLLEIKNRALSKKEADTAQEVITFLKGIIAGGTSQFVNLIASGKITAENIDVNDTLKTQILHALVSATLQDVILKGQLNSETFTSGFLGSGFRLNKIGENWVLELDEIIVRKSMQIYELIVQRARYQGGQVLHSPAGGKITAVTNGGTYWRIEHDSPDDFIDGDQIQCQNFKVGSVAQNPDGSTTFDGVSVKRYWRLVTSYGRGWFNLSKTDMEAGSAEPEVGDDIAVLGNRTDPARQNAYMIVSTGANSPYTAHLAGINSYSTEGKEVTREGNLSGIVDDVFGQLSGYGLYGQNVFLRGRFSIQSGSTTVLVPADKGTWSAGTYYYYDRVSHNGSLWLCIAQPSTTSEPSDGSSAWEKQVEKGQDGSSAPLLYLSTTADAMTFNADGTPNPASQTISVTAKLQNVTGTAVFTATPYVGSTAQSNITLGGSGNTRTLTQAQWGANIDRIVITATLGSLTDTVTVVKLKDGATGAAGKGVSSTAVTYQIGSSGTTAPTGTWSTSVPSTSPGQFLWTRTITTYTDASTSTAYSVSVHGATGGTGAAGRGISSTAVTYQAGSSGTTAPTGTWTSTVPSVAQNQYLWSRTITTYTDSTTTTAYSVGKMGANGIDPVTGYLTNESATLPASSDGTVSDFSGANGQFKVFEGTTDKTSSATFTKVSNTGCTAAITSAGAISASAMSADNATVVFRAVYNGVTIEKTLTLAKSKQGGKGDTGEELSSGKMLYKDPTFKSGNNGTTLYNNTSDKTPTTWTRVAKPSDAPTDSTHIMRYSYDGNTPAPNPGFGGFVVQTQSRANAVFVHKIIAKIPVGKNIMQAQNATGTGRAVEWLTPRAGTGKYETYMYKHTCGVGGTFSTFGYVYFTDGANEAFEVDVAYATIFDMTLYDDTYDKKIVEYDAKFIATDQGISANAQAITSTQDSVTGLTSRVSEAEGQLTMQAGQIASKVSQTEYDANNVAISGQFSTINQRATNIELSVSTNERQGVNLAIDSNRWDRFVNYSGTSSTRSVVSVSEWGANDANRVVTSGGSSVLKCIYFAFTPADGQVVSESIYFKNNGSTRILLHSNQGNRNEWIEPGVSKRVKFEGIIGNGVGNLQIQTRSEAIDDALDFTWWRIKTELGDKVTPWSVNPNELPDKLLATGINIENGKITITANNSIFQDNNGNPIALFNSTGTKIQAAAIELEGLVTVNSKFKVLLDGSIEAVDGKFTGQITATSGTIGGFTIGSSYIGAGSSWNGSANGMSLWEDFIVFNKPDRQALIGATSSLGFEFLGRFSDTGSSLYDKTGVIFNITGASGNNTAIALAGGHISGLAMRAKRISTGTTLTRSDTFVSVYNASVITIYLPSTPEVGEIKYIYGVNSSNIIINGNGNQFKQKNTSATSTYTITTDNRAFIWDGQYWITMSI